MAESDTVSLCGALEDINQCPICREPLNQPKLLPCGHSFCLTCLEKTYATRCPSGTIICSMDRSKHPLPRGGIAGLPNDHKTNKTIDILQRHRQAEKVPTLPRCVFCKSSADSYCINCNMPLCSNCHSRKHESSKSYADHIVLLISDTNVRDLMCRNHKNQFNTEFCTDCDSLLCKACALDDHDAHNVSPLVDIEKYATEIGKPMKRVQSFYEMVDDQYNQVNSSKCGAEHKKIELKMEINQHIDRLIGFLQAKRGSLLTEAESYFKPHETYYSSLLETLSTAKDNAKSIKNYLIKKTQVVPMNPNIAPKTIDISGLKQQQEGLRVPAVTLPTIDCEFCPYESLNVGEVSMRGQLKDQKSSLHGGQHARDTLVKGIRDLTITESAASLDDYLDDVLKTQESQKINIGVTGESGSGKSSFINTFLGLRVTDNGAAKTGTAVTTMSLQPYSHPDNDNVVLWDMPGVNTPYFPKCTYIEKMKLTNFDGLIVCTATRFSDIDCWLASTSIENKIPFYLVRTKVDQEVTNARDDADIDEDQAFRETEINTRRQLRGARLPANTKLYLISSKFKFKAKFHFPALINDILNICQK